MVHPQQLRRLFAVCSKVKHTPFISNRPRALFCSGSSPYDWNERILPDDVSARCSRRRHADDVRWNNIVALDCEMLSCRPTERFMHAAPRKKRRPVEVSVAGRCAVVGYNYQVLYDSFIRPGPSTAVVTNWKGIRPHEILDAPSLDEAREEILELLKNKLIVAHDIRHDLASLQISLGAHIPPGNIRDTSNCGILLRMAGIPARFPRASLRHLAMGVLGRRVQTKTPHCPVEDATATMELYKAVEKEWER